jgi:hypothetical protein
MPNNNQRFGGSSSSLQGVQFEILLTQAAGLVRLPCGIADFRDFGQGWNV